MVDRKRAAAATTAAAASAAATAMPASAAGKASPHGSPHHIFEVPLGVALYSSHHLHPAYSISTAFIPSIWLKHICSIRLPSILPIHHLYTSTPTSTRSTKQLHDAVKFSRTHASEGHLATCLSVRRCISVSAQLQRRFYLAMQRC